MKLRKAIIKNFRLLKKCQIDFDDNLTWIVGKNNTGKTSFLFLMDNYFNNNNYNLSYNDFSREIRKNIINVNENTDVSNYSIRLLMEIEYSINDNLENISEFINDLSSDNNWC